MSAQNFGLLNNSLSYFQEAVQYTIRPSIEVNHWKFAILHVVQAMELAFKERLRRVHPAFIYDSVDKREKTVTIRTALGRLRDPEIGNLAISPEDEKKLASAYKLRNQLTHFEFDYSTEYMEIKFAEIFGFMLFFYRAHLEVEAVQIIDEESLTSISRLVKASKEIKARAKIYISSLEDQQVWLCSACGEDSFILAEEQCCVCHHKEKVTECPTCGEETYEADLIDISSSFEWDWVEGRSLLQDDFGFEDQACPDCIVGTQSKIAEMRRAQYDEDLAMEEYHHWKAEQDQRRELAAKP